jgi:hypothetical protein
MISDPRPQGRRDPGGATQSQEMTSLESPAQAWQGAASVPRARPPQEQHWNSGPVLGRPAHRQTQD